MMMVRWWWSLDLELRPVCWPSLDQYQYLVITGRVANLAVLTIFNTCLFEIIWRHASQTNRLYHKGFALHGRHILNHKRNSQRNSPNSIIELSPIWTIFHNRSNNIEGRRLLRWVHSPPRHSPRDSQYLEISELRPFTLPYRLVMDIFALSFGGWKGLSEQDKKGINK